MILTDEDIDAYQNILERHERAARWQLRFTDAIARHGADASSVAAEVIGSCDESELEAVESGTRPQDILGYIRCNPQLLIASGFDEIRIDPEPTTRVLAAIAKVRSERWGSTPPPAPSFTAWLEAVIGLRCRETASGVWLKLKGLGPDLDGLVFTSDAQPNRLEFPLRSILATARHSIHAGTHPAVVLLPNLWREPRAYPRIELADSTSAILKELQQGTATLREIPWPQLEELVAELLKGRGLSVTVTPRSHDGGRDIIARGELVPGEPSVLAVEVKQKAVVQIDDLRSRLWANREFPLLMLATSGRFAAGVIREKERPENFLRLLLKDGNGLMAWIKQHRANAS